MKTKYIFLVVSTIFLLGTIKFHLDKYFVYLSSQEVIEKNELSTKRKLVLFDDFFIYKNKEHIEDLNIWSRDFRKKISKMGLVATGVQESGVAFCSYEKILIEKFCTDDYDFYFLSRLTINLSEIGLLKHSAIFWNYYLYAVYYLRGKDALYSELMKKIETPNIKPDIQAISVIWINYFYHQYPRSTFLDFEEFMRARLRGLVSNPLISKNERKRISILYIKYDLQKIQESRDSFNSFLSGFDEDFQSFLKAYLAEVRGDQGVGYLYSLALNSLKNDPFLLPYFLNHIALNKDDLFSQTLSKTIKEEYENEERKIIKKLSGAVRALSRIQYFSEVNNL